MTRSLFTAVAVALMLFSEALAREAPDTGLSDFLETYQCPVARLIGRIHSLPEKKYPDDRYIILAPVGAGSSYVQCLMGDHDDSQALCEVASGWWAKGDAPHFVPGALDAIARLGFSTNGSHGNYQQHLHFASGPNPDTLARLMLTALHDAYGADKSMSIEVQAPYLLRGSGVLRKNRCIPIS